MDEKPKNATVLTESMRDMLHGSLTSLGLDVRTINHLEGIGVLTVHDLLMCSRARLLEIPNVGAKTLTQIYQQLENHGFIRYAAEGN